MRDAAIGSTLLRSEIVNVRNPLSHPNTTSEIGESTQGIFFQFARDIPNEFANGDFLTYILV